MYGKLYEQKKVAPAQQQVLTPQIVGALLRRRRDITHAAQGWGDASLDSQIPNLALLETQYPLTHLMQWIVDNHVGYDMSYIARWNEHWNKTEAVAVDMSGSQVPLMLAMIKGEMDVKPMNRGILDVGKPTEQINHQLASALVAMNPPQNNKMVDGDKCRPSICDSQGVLGPSVILFPLIPEERDDTGKVNPKTAEGGPLAQAYTSRSGGTEGIVSRIEGFLNTPEPGQSVMGQHTDVCNVLYQAINIARHEDKALPAWFNPFSMREYNGQDRARMVYVTTFPDKSFRSVDTMYNGLTLMSRTCGVKSRAGYVHDGHFFSDMPPGIARKIHVIGNVMDAVYFAGTPFVRVDTVGGYLAKVKALLPLNMSCISPNATVAWSPHLKHAGLTDGRFIAGTFVPFKNCKTLMFRYLDQGAPTLKDKKIVYSPANAAVAIQENIKLVPCQAGTTIAYILYAQPSLWTDKNNFIRPLNYCDGMVMVLRCVGLGSNSVGHVTEAEYRTQASKFFYSRVMYPYTRLPWPQVSGVPHSRVVIRKGQISVTDDAYTKVVTELFEGSYEWAGDDAMYTASWKGDVVADLKVAIQPPVPLPKVVPQQQPQTVVPEKVEAAAPPPDEDLGNLYDWS